MVQKPSDKLENKVDPAERKKKSAIPKAVKRPLDHQPAKADVPEKDRGITTTVEYEGQEYTTVLSAEEVGRNLDLMEMLSDGNILPPMRQILGPAQWQRFKNDFRDEETGVTDAEHAGKLFRILMKEMRLENS